MVKKTPKGRITIDKDFCKGCYLCISVCPQKVIGASDTLNQKGYYPAAFMASGKDGKSCIACAMCATICPDVAIEVYRE
jgi:2-oxoglutarate ferredoxin oxidoreductase subunit delta